MIPKIERGPWVYLVHGYQMWCEREDAAVLKSIKAPGMHIVAPIRDIVHPHEHIRKISIFEEAIGQAPSAIVCVERSLSTNVRILRLYAEINNIPFHFFDRFGHRTLMREAHGLFLKCEGSYSEEEKFPFTELSLEVA